MDADKIKIGGIGPIGINIDTYKHLIPKNKKCSSIYTHNNTLIVETMGGFIIVKSREGK